MLATSYCYCFTASQVASYIYGRIELLGCIERIRCGLLQLMFPWCGVSVDRSCACLAKLVERIEVLFGVDSRNIVLQGVISPMDSV